MQINNPSAEPETGDQSAVIAFLSTPESFPDAASGVTRIDTHAAIVFLAGERAYKLKRAVKLPYLDFSTVEKRRRVLMREFDINFKLSPELYLSVEPITEDGGVLRFGGTGEAIDWVLVMRRFDTGALFDRLAESGALDRDLMGDLARAIETFHRNAPSSKTSGWVASLFTVPAHLEKALCGPGASAIGLHLDPYIERLRAGLAASVPLLEARQHAGFVRICHGDLHLKNIVLLNGKPKLFDALEFDEKLATIDVLYDFAFLLMDIWHRRLHAEANAVFNHSLQRGAISQLQGLALLPLFLSLRAAIQAMTALHNLEVNGASVEASALEEIRSYAALAEEFLRERPAQLVAIGGLSGTGKSFTAREIAPFIGAPPGAVHLRTDFERKLMYGVALDHRLPDSAYRPETSSEVYRRVFKKAEIILDAGHSVIIDAVFPDAITRAMAREVAQKANVSFSGFWLDATAAQMQTRAASRRGDVSDADAEVISRQLQTVKAPEDWTRVDGSGQAGSAGKTVLHKLTVL